MSVNGLEALPDIREWSGGSSGMSGSGWEALPKVLEWSGYPLGCPGVVGRPSQMCGSGR